MSTATSVGASLGGFLSLPEPVHNAEQSLLSEQSIQVFRVVMPLDERYTYTRSGRAD